MCSLYTVYDVLVDSVTSLEPFEMNYLRKQKAENDREQLSVEGSGFEVTTDSEIEVLEVSD